MEIEGVSLVKQTRILISRIAEAGPTSAIITTFFFFEQKLNIFDIIRKRATTIRNFLIEVAVTIPQNFFILTESKLRAG